MNRLLFTATLALFALPAFGQNRTPLYSMGSWGVSVQEGDTPRIPQLSHKTHELDDERSSPLSDPSRPTGYHFVLNHFLPQTQVAENAALNKLNPFSKRGFIRGNWNQSEDDSYYRTQFSLHEPIVAFLKSRQNHYLYGNLNLIDGPALVNSDYEFDGISDRAFGYCWGFSTFNRNFAYLAFFDPSLKAPVAYIPNGKARNRAWFRFYEPILNDILNGTPRVVPGFKNFSEFSAVPEIEFYLKVTATQAWAIRAISSGSLKTFFTSTEELGEEGIDSLLRSLRQKLNRGELPKILFTAADSRKQFGGSLDVHSVIANGVKLNPDGTGKIEIWDINFYFSDLIQSPKSLEIRYNSESGKRELHYAQWWEQKENPEATYRSSLLGKVRISPEDNSEMGNIIRNLKKFCRSAATAPYCKVKTGFEAQSLIE